MAKGKKRTLELLVEKNEGGYEPPPLPQAKLSEALPPLDVIRAAMPFHFEALRAKPADSWPDYYERMKVCLDDAGFVIDRPGLQAIKKLMTDAKCFKMLPNQGGITLVESFASMEELWASVLDCQSHVPQVSPAVSDEVVSPN